MLPLPVAAALRSVQSAAMRGLALARNSASDGEKSLKAVVVAPK